MTALHTLALLLGTAWPVLAQERGHALDEQLELATKAAAAKAAPCVVRIQTVGGMEFIGNAEQGSMMQRGRGPTTGVIISPDGYIISSSFNFLHKPSAITVYLPGGKESVAAKIVAQDLTRMVTLLKVDVPPESQLPVAEPVPKSQIRLGQWSMALGRTLADNPTAPPSVSVGIISATERIWGKALQTDAKVSPVNYGGPLIDLQGRVLGILVPLSPRAEGEMAGVEWYDGGIGFAVPLEDILQVLPRLKEGKDLQRGVMGFRPKGTDEFSVAPVIDSIEPDSAADKAGLQPGDQIVEMEGKTISRYVQLRHILGPKYAGDKVTLKVKRGDKVLTMSDLELRAPTQHHAQAFLGILPMRDDAKPGIEIRYVFPDSPAAKAGLKVGDRIMALGGRPLTGRDLLLAVLASQSPGAELSFNVQRKEGNKLDTVKLRLGLYAADVPPADLPEATKKQALVHKNTPAQPGRPNQPRLPDMPGQPRQQRPQPTKPKAPPKQEEKPKEVKKGYLERKDEALGRSAWVYVPENYDPNISYALIVWLHPRGDTMEAAIRRTWEPLCKQYHFILYAPRAENPSGWLTSEIDNIRADMQELRKEYTIDPQRIVLHGLGNGADLALYMGFDSPEAARGVAAIGGFLPPSMTEKQTSSRLSFFLFTGAKDPNLEALRNVQNRLHEKKFPVVYREIPNLGTGYLPHPDLIKELVRWIEALDRM
jgi:S1-C subfamily serine protease/predicted esterase